MTNLAQKYASLDKLVGGNQENLKQDSRLGGNIGAKVVVDVPATIPARKTSSSSVFAHSGISTKLLLG